MVINKGFIMEVNQLIGVICVITSLLFFILEVFIYHTFYKKKFLLKNTAYKLILLLSILETAQQISQLAGGISSIIEKKLPIVLERFLGALLQTSFIVAILTTLFLTLNRFYIFYKSIIYNYVNQRLITKIAIGILISFYISLFVTYSFKDYGLQYNVDTCDWNYIMDADIPIPIYKFEYLFVLSTLLLCFCFYMLIFGRILLQRITMPSNNNRKLLNSSDFRLLIHVIFIFVYSVFVEVLWWYLEDWFPDSNFTRAILNYAWLIYCGMNTTLNIIIIKEIREEFFELITCNKCKRNIEGTVTPCVSVKQVKEKVIIK
uniref:7TM_GPCR_Srx domain-containing protein n=1 Tax=Parastrongyloides trichosuri TaxID=131310 RepID=A0A0N4ZW19_PARTI